MPKHVVIWDPKGKYPEGTILEDGDASPVRAHGAVLLPLVSGQGRKGAGGWAKRSFGRGEAFSALPTHVAPVVLACVPDVYGLAWAARLVPCRGTDLRSVAAADAFERGEGGQGFIRAASDTGQGVRAFAPVSEHSLVPDVAKLGKIDAQGGWTIEGRCKVMVQGEDLYPFSLHGSAVGLAVAWVAVSQYGAERG